MKFSLKWGVKVEQPGPDGKGKETVTKFIMDDKRDVEAAAVMHKGKVTRVRVLK